MKRVALALVALALSAGVAGAGTRTPDSSAGVPSYRKVNTSSPLSGGGKLGSGDLTLTCPSCVQLNPSGQQTGSLNFSGIITMGDSSSAGTCAAGLGCFRYNNTTKVFEYSVDAGSWTAFGGGGGVTFPLSNGTSPVSFSYGGSDSSSAVGFIFNAPNGMAIAGDAWFNLQTSNTTRAIVQPSPQGSTPTGIKITNKGAGTNAHLILDESTGAEVGYTAGVYSRYGSSSVTTTSGSATVSIGSNVSVTGALVPSATNTYPLGGLSSQSWKGLFNSANFGCGFNSQAGTTYTAVATDCNVLLTNLNARTVTMPAATAVQPGAHLYIWDGNNNAGTNNVSVARAGTDTINGGTTNVAVVTANSGHSTCVSDGSSKWVCSVNN